MYIKNALITTFVFIIGYVLLRFFLQGQLNMVGYWGMYTGTVIGQLLLSKNRKEEGGNLLKRKKSVIAIVAVWLIIGLSLVVAIFAVGNSNPDARPLITTLSYIYIFCVPIVWIILGFIERKQIILRVVLGIVFWAFLLWFLFLSPLF